MVDRQRRPATRSTEQSVEPEDLPSVAGSLTLAPLSGGGLASKRGRETVKLTVNLPAETVSGLRALASDRGVTVTEAVRQAIESERFLQAEVRRGGRVLVETAAGAVTQLVLR